MKTNRERALELWNSLWACNRTKALAAIESALDEAVADANKERFDIDEAINEVVELAASYSKSIPGMSEALQRVWDIEDARGAK